MRENNRRCAPRATGHTVDARRADGKDAKLTSDFTISTGRADAGWNPEAALRLVGLPALMQGNTGVPSVTVGLIDGPVALNHTELASENVRVLEESRGGACTKPESTACTHGTYVAGILHAKRDSHVRGICPGCTLLVRSIFSETAEVSDNNACPTQPSGSWPPRFVK